MLFTKASEYALLSMILLAKNNASNDVDTMSNELKISKSFLAKILQNLARDNILISFKGANGGFVLSRPPEQITIKDIFESAEKRRVNVFECSVDNSVCSNQKGINCQIWTIFHALQCKVDDFLNNITLADLIKK